MTLAVMESSRLMVNQPMETACIVFNMEGFTLANMVSDFLHIYIHGYRGSSLLLCRISTLSSSC